MSWNGVRVLVTGADGFIGSHLTEALVRSGAQVRAFCMYNSTGSLGWLDELSGAERSGFEPRLGDIRDAGMVDAACDNIDVVFHLAALVAIPYSYRAPESFVDTNVRGTLNVLEAVRRRRVRRLVQTSTSEVYGTPESLPILETHPLQGQSPYSASKIAADKMCQAYHLSFDLPVVTLRPFNTFGPRQSARAVIPAMLAQLLAGRKVIRLGKLTPRRDLTFVDDTVRGFLAAGATPDVEGMTIQLGTGRADSIAEVFDAAVKACGVDARVEEDAARVRPVKSEVMVLQSDPTLAKTLLGWQATTSLEDGLRRTVDWMRENTARYRPDQYAV